MSKPLADQIIMRARQLIEDELSWIQYVTAILKNGNPVEPHHPGAVRFRASGALVHAGFELTGDVSKAMRLRDTASARLVPKHPQPVYAVEDINNGRYGQDAILRLFDEYLEKA
jgi:hypothetical protein